MYDVTNPDTSPTGGTNDTRYVIDDAGNFVTNRVSRKGGKGVSSVNCKSSDETTGKSPR
jgi:hypothetical protein